MVSLESDSFDYLNVITVIAKEVKTAILARKPNALGQSRVGCSAPIPATHAYLAGYRDNQLVRGTDGGFRKIGDRYIVEANGLHVTEAKRKGSAECLWDIYGVTLTDKGYRMILTCLADKGFAPSNVAGFLHLQHAVAPHMWPGHEGDLRGSR